jgi:glycosyltransferase involved in cell wall biosynthesis
MLVNVSSKPMSILFIANSAYFLHHYYEHLLAFFTSSGYCVSIIVPLENNAMEKDFPTDYATYFLPFFHAYQFDGFKQIKLHRELKKKLLETKPSAVLSFTFKISIAAAIVCRSLQIPFIPTFTGLGFLFMHQKIIANVSGFFLKKIFQQCPMILFQNREDGNYFLRNKWINIEKMNFIAGSGICPTYYQPITYPKRKKTRVILYLGRIQYDKGIQCLIASLKRLKNENIPFQCLIAGKIGGGHPTDIPLFRMLEWEKEGIIQYVGNHSDVRPLIAMANIIVQPSKREGLSRTILEALACGRPVVSSTAPGCAELIKEGENGWLFPTDNIQELTVLFKKILLMPYSKLLSMAKQSPGSIPPCYFNLSIHQGYALSIEKIMCLK